jgi:UDP-N-acetylmuramate dehydrogenase
MGLASNLLVRDGGVPGVVIKLGNAFAGVSIDGDVITAGAGAPDRKVANQARAAGLTGLEFLTGIPGRIGGAVKMNAGAYGQEVKDCFIAAEVIDRTGQRQWRSADALGFGYRHSALADDDIVVAAQFRGQREDPAAIAARMSDITTRRAATQPVQSKTGGSTFANPSPDLRAWQLVDQVGGRGLRVGGAAVSTLHSNFIVNTGNATAADVEALGELLRVRVEAAQGIALRWEVARIGLPLALPPAKPDGGAL